MEAVSRFKAKALSGERVLLIEEQNWLETSNEDNLRLQDEGVELGEMSNGIGGDDCPEVVIVAAAVWLQVVRAATGICASGPEWHQSCHSVIMRPAIVSKRLEVFVALIMITAVVVDKTRNICAHTLTSSSHAGRFSCVTPIPFASSHTKPGFDFSTVITLYFLFN
jgi:hypothetical protein